MVDRKGRALLTEYGLAPINSDPSFTVAATPGAVGTSRWTAPEIMTPTRKGAAMPVIESKPADIFAFAMVAVEVFTGKIPFEEQRNEAVVLRISQGGRPAMSVNSRDVGLTDEMWGVLESCWQQNPKKRPGVGEVAKRWQRSVASTDNDDEFIPLCVRTILTMTLRWLHAQISWLIQGAGGRTESRSQSPSDEDRGPSTSTSNEE